MEFWKDLSETMPDWAATAAFLALALALFVSFVTTTEGSGVTKKLIVLSTGAVIYFYWFR